MSWIPYSRKLKIPVSCEPYPQGYQELPDRDVLHILTMCKGLRNGDNFQVQLPGATLSPTARQLLSQITVVTVRIAALTGIRSISSLALGVLLL